MNVLVLSAGRRVSLVRGFQDAMAEHEGQVYAADMNPQMSAACQVADKNYCLPHCLEADFIPQLLKLCSNEKISLVVPTIDTELEVLSTAAEKFNAIGTVVLISDVEIINICRDKRLTSDFFKRIGLATPELYHKDKIKFPVLVKPYDGSLSSGVVLVREESALTSEILGNEKNMYCQYIDHDTHDEFTIDMYFDRNSDLRCVVPRQRLEVRGGEVSKGMTVKNFLVEKLFDCFEGVSGIRGCVNLQVFVNRETQEFWSIEINPRFGGGYPLTRLSGATFERWAVDEYLSEKSVASFHGWEDQLIMLRYDDEVLVSGR